MVEICLLDTSQLVTTTFMYIDNIYIVLVEIYWNLLDLLREMECVPLKFISDTELFYVKFITIEAHLAVYSWNCIENRFYVIIFSV